MGLDDILNISPEEEEAYSKKYSLDDGAETPQSETDEFFNEDETAPSDAEPNTTDMFSNADDENNNLTNDIPTNSTDDNEPVVDIFSNDNDIPTDYANENEPAVDIFSNNNENNDAFSNNNTTSNDDAFNKEAQDETNTDYAEDENAHSGETNDSFSNDNAENEGNSFLQEDGGNDAETGSIEDETAVSNDEDAEDDGAFIPKAKTKPENLFKGKPPVLNKNFILAAIVGVFSIFLIFSTFIIPLLKNKKTADDENRLALRETRDTDYSKLVPERPKLPLEDTNIMSNITEPDYDDYEDLVITRPQDDPNYRPIYEVSPQNQPAAQSYSAPSGPTLAQRMAENMNKSISGIKGISGTQKQNTSGAETQTAQENNPYAQFGLPSKEDYTKQILSQYNGEGMQVRSTTNDGSDYTSQNDQAGKSIFANSGRENAGEGQYLSPSSVWMGTIFDAVLTSAINTDLPGECTAMVTKNVYSSQDGRYLIIPQNSKLFGSYNSSISYAQSRVQIGWHTLIRPDGYQINLGNMNATDPQGASGIAGIINDHPLAYLKALGLMSVFNIVGREYSTQMGNTTNPYIQDLIANDMDVTNKMGEKLIDRALNIQPTIRIKEGTRINIVANHTLYLPPLDPYKVSMRYIKN